MTRFIDQDTKVVVQGITGEQGTFHTKLMRDFGTNIVASVTPGRGGQEVESIPVYDTVREAKEDGEIDASIIFVPAPFSLDAALEAIEADLDPVVVITEGLPVRDSIELVARAKRKGTTIVGTNTPGLIKAGESKMGIMPASLFAPGTVGVISRSGTLSYEFAGILSETHVGQSTVLGMGADPVVLTNLPKILKLFEEDSDTEAVIIVGEVGGEQEERAAEFIADHMKKPVAAYIAGKYSPQGKRMGHAGAIVRGTSGTVDGKYAALKEAGVTTLASPIEVATWAKEHKLN